MAAPRTNPSLLLLEKVGRTLFASYPAEKNIPQEELPRETTYCMLTNLIPPPLRKSQEVNSGT